MKWETGFLLLQKSSQKGKVMHWFYVENSQIFDNSITIIGSDVNHIKNVLRMEKGEKVVICNGQGKDFYCIIKSVTNEEVIVEIQEMNDSESELPSKLYLFQGIPKKDKMELVIQKAVELGVFEIIPVAMKRCVAKIDNKKKEIKKIERWQSIATAAAKQSGRGIIPNIHSVMNFEEAIQYAKTMEFGIVPYEQEKNREKSKEIIQQCYKYKTIAIFIGPEGGFDDKEIDKVIEAKMHPITLGKRILRTETAGLTMLSILMFELEDENR